MLKENTLFGVEDKVQKSIERLQAFCPPEGYVVAFSGGKDSQCIYHLAKMAGVKFEAVYNVTSVDPPELVRFIKEHYPDVRFEIPRDSEGRAVTMWSLIVKRKMLPLRTVRYCCTELKEANNKGRLTVTGVRWAESIRRKKLHGIVSTMVKGTAGEMTNDRGNIILNDDNDENRRMVEHCYRTSKVLVNPIVDWTDEDVWEFLNHVAKVPHCCLYDEGYTRIGCIGCPMATPRERQRSFERWPGYKKAYIKAIERMVVARGKPCVLFGDKTDSTDAHRIFQDWIS